MANYAVTMTRTASTTASLGTISSSATRARRTEWYDYTFGSPAAPADNAFLYVVQRFTAPGTNTSVTPQPLDPADFATESVAGQLNTVEPTYTANQILDSVPINQRATYRWWCQDTGRLVTPATASNGLGIATPTSSAVVIYAKVLYCER
jgi:hypothetical protein